MIQVRFRKLMKEQSDLAPIVEAYKEYKTMKAEYRRFSWQCWKKNADEEMRELAKEELY